MHRILIVDDNPAITDILARMVRHEGLEAAPVAVENVDLEHLWTGDPENGPMPLGQDSDSEYSDEAAGVGVVDPFHAIVPGRP